MVSKDEARAALIEHGQTMLAARIKIHEAQEEWIEAAKTVPADAVHEHLNYDEQEECFRESCALLGVDPEHPAFALERESFQHYRAEEHYQRMRDNAQMN